VLVRSLRFLLSRRWLAFAVVVAALVYLAWALGQWQFHRLEERQQRNQITERNETSHPVPARDVLAVDRPVGAQDEWRLVTLVGTYDVDHTVIVRYRTYKGTSGVDVVVPLVDSEGTALLVDRGWLMSDNVGGRPADIPPPPAGLVRVTGWVRADATGDATQVTDDGSTRAISSVTIGRYLDREVFGGFLSLAGEDPDPETPLRGAQPPELGNGPHFFYGLQWWFFALLAIIGFCYLAWEEWRDSTRSF
jgi:cytochrome oxidase assembly protein ShyY1